MLNYRATGRREFLATGTALAAAALGVPCFVSRRALAAPGRPGANDRIGIGYIGCGRRSAQLRGLPAAGQIVAAADCNLPRAEAVAVQYQARAYQDYRRLLDDPNVDAVIVASPDHWHALHTIQACQAGKDVYVEKPLALTIREGRLMVEAARKYERIVQVGSQQRSMRGNIEGRELVRRGRIGKITEVIAANYASPWECRLPAQRVPAGLDWDQWLGPTEVVPYHLDLYTPRAQPGWISFRPWSGGELTGWGSHGLDQIQWLLGKDQSGPVEIGSEGPKFDPPVYNQPESRQRGEQAGQSPAVWFRYEDGVTLRFGNGDPGGGTLIGDAGTMRVFRGGYEIVAEGGASLPAERRERLRDETENHLQNWFDSLRSRELPRADVEIGHRSAVVCHLGNIARWTGRKLRWDPVHETFPGDPEANALLDRTRRAPYQLPDRIGS